MSPKQQHVRPFGYGRVYLPLYKVADTPFHIYPRGRLLSNNFAALDVDMQQ